MSRHQFVHELESTAGHIADASRADLQVLLRRAALVLRSVGGISLDARTDDGLTSLAAEMARPSRIWWKRSSAIGLSPMHTCRCRTLDEESNVDGSA